MKAPFLLIIPAFSLLLLFGCDGKTKFGASSSLTSSSIPSTIAETKQKINVEIESGTILETIADAFILDARWARAAEKASQRDEQIWGSDPERCPHNSVSWDRFWKCKDGKIKGDAK